MKQTRWLSEFSCLSEFTPLYPVDRISMELQMLYFNGSYVEILNMKICYIFETSADPDLGLHCLPRYLFAGIWNEMIRSQTQ